MEHRQNRTDGIHVFAAGAARAFDTRGPEEQRPPAAPEPQQRILVVNRPEAGVIPLFRILGRTNLRISWRTTCADGIAAMNESGTAVVVCERDLPDGTWRDLLAHAGSLPHPPPVIVASRLADERLWAEVLNLGGYDVLAKPFEAGEVLHVVSVACRRTAMDAAGRVSPPL